MFFFTILNFLLQREGVIKKMIEFNAASVAAALQGACGLVDQYYYVEQII